jgi:hypothetical protein
MKRSLVIGLIAAVLASSYSFVYACDHDSKASSAQASAHAKTIRTYVVGATTRCNMTGNAPVVTVDIDVPPQTACRLIHVVACDKSVVDQPSPLRTAMTLGRAFVTTVEAVVGSLIDVATQKTALG